MGRLYLACICLFVGNNNVLSFRQLLAAMPSCENRAIKTEAFVCESLFSEASELSNKTSINKADFP